jgi:predicted enzyme related to lactoylglutathione lyase
VAPSPERGAFIWYELMTPDPGAAKAFYDAVVGWTIEPEGVQLPTGATYRMIGRSDGGQAGGVLGMATEMIEQSGKAAWFGYIHTPDVDAAAAHLTASGGAVHMPPMDMPGVGRMAMVADPWGATFYLMTPTPPADDPNAKSDVWSKDQPQHVRWNELRTTDPGGAVALYSELFGWRQEGSMPMGDLGDYLFVEHEGTMIGAIMPVTLQSTGSTWSYYIGVDDIDRAARAVRDNGGSLNTEIMQIPGGEYSVDCIDPQGAAFGLVGPRKE